MTLSFTFKYDNIKSNTIRYQNVGIAVNFCLLKHEQITPRVVKKPSNEHSLHVETCNSVSCFSESSHISSWCSFFEEIPCSYPVQRPAGHHDSSSGLVMKPNPHKHRHWPSMWFCLAHGPNRTNKKTSSGSRGGTVTNEASSSSSSSSHLQLGSPMVPSKILLKERRS